MASHSHQSETDLDGVKKVLAEPNMQMQSGKHYSFSSAGTAWHLIADKVGIIYILICQTKYPQRCAYAALEEMQQKFASNFREKATTAKSGALNNVARGVLSACCVKFDNLAAVDRLAAVNKKVESVKLQMQENVDMALQNCVKLEALERDAEELQQQAGVFKHNAKELKKKMWWKKIKMQLLVGFILLAALGGLIGMIVYLTDDKK